MKRELLLLSFCFVTFTSLHTQVKKETTVTATTSIEVPEDIAINAKKQQQSIPGGSVVVEGKNINYHAVAGILVLKTETDTPTVSMSYVAYFKDGEDASRRPI